MLRRLRSKRKAMLESEEKLIERFRGGDREALGQWLNMRRGPLLAFIERRLGTALRRKVDPDDLLQEVNTEAIRCFGEMDLSQREPFSWLCQIAERRIIDAHRRFFGSQKRDAGREVPLSAGSGDDSRAGLIDLLVASMTTASQAFSRDQRQIRLIVALEKLPEEQREALKMRYIEDLPSKTIAERLGKTDGSIRVMLTRSLAKLQQMLED
jgi:RNA polymerase sigma-70 factor, ECF subfamily